MDHFKHGHCRMLILASVLLIAHGQAACPAYIFVELAPPVSISSAAFGESNGEQVGEVVWQNMIYHAALWSGSPASLLDLHPSGFMNSSCSANSGFQQVGYGETWTNFDQPHALLWSGSAASVVYLHPAGYSRSEALGVSGGKQYGFGYHIQSQQSHALMWSGSAASVVDLHPAGYDDSSIGGAYGDQQVGQGIRTGLRAVLWHGTALSAVDLTPPGYFGATAVGVGNG